MNFEWISISPNDVTSLALAFILGLLFKSVSLPPLVGFLSAGFILNVAGIADQELVQKLADLGITLLLFTVGLKVNLKTLVRPQVWAVTGIHTSLITVVFALILASLAMFGLPVISSLDVRSILLIAFALSFSSTVFVVKALEEKGEMKSLHGRLTIGILIMQDIAAVIFLAMSANKLPSVWALSLFLLIPLRYGLHKILSYLGHGELMILYGFVLAMGGAEIFELVGMKGDLGALVLGILIAPHVRADEMSKAMLGFKDLFLLGFFLSIGLSGELTWEVALIGAIITPFVFLKSVGFFVLLTAFKLRARTSLLTTINLTNHSEFGLIITAIGVSIGWIGSEWLVIVAIAVSFSFAIAAVLNAKADSLYYRFRPSLDTLQRSERLADDRLLDIGDAAVVIVGMGRVGSSAYDQMHHLYGDKVIGVDIDPAIAKSHQAAGRNVLQGDPTDPDFWERVQYDHTLELVLLTLPKLNTTLEVVEQLSNASFEGEVAATSRFPDDIESLKQHGVDMTFNIYTEAGVGFATHVSEQRAKPDV
ncbi:MAG: glutathione-regulated potassium-efflux system ancillary protein KefC [Arenicella sp.]|jgi:glutathione-regulated potassium-efflux system ancillary protein KefC